MAIPIRSAGRDPEQDPRTRRAMDSLTQVHNSLLARGDVIEEKPTEFKLNLMTEEAMLFLQEFGRF